MPDKFETEISVFYPTKKKSIQDAYWGDSDLIMKWAFSMIRKPHFMWRLFFKVFMSFIQKLKLNVEKNSPILQDKLKVIIFSPGFSANRNSYTCFTKELASQGYVTFCLEHYENMKIPGYATEKDATIKLNMIKTYRNNNLEDRFLQT